ncbi:MAG TPA: hypothetical protein VGO62_20075 [Myxococcota bacterium]
MHARVAALLLLLPLAGCSESPAQGFEAFYAALAAGSDDAFARLSPRGQDAFRAAAHSKDPAHFLASALPKTTVRSIEVVSESDSAADLDVKDALGQSQRVHMTKAGARWLVDVTP